MAAPFFSELKYLGGANQDFIEVSVNAGTDVSDIVVTVYRSDGSIRSSSDLSVLTPTTINGFDVYVLENGDATNFNGIALSEAVSLSENGTVYQFLSFDNTAGGVTANGGPADGMTSTDVGRANGGESLESTDFGNSYFTQSNPDPGNVTCFANGTQIMTKDGLVKVEDLSTGTEVLTFDGSFKPLKLVLSQVITREALAKNPKLWPVRIKAGSLGTDLPKKDLLVSRQHRMLVASPIAERMFGQLEVLVPAVRLTSLPGILSEEPKRPVTYYHLVFEDHEVIFAEGAPSESFHLGPVAVNALPKACLDEFGVVFGRRKFVSDEETRFPVPSQRKQKQLISRHLKNQKTLLRA